MAEESLAEHLAGRPFAIALSSGFFGFYAHAGLMAALEEAGLSPARLAGSSAGALVAGMWAAGLPAAALTEELLALERADFWDPWPGLGLLRGQLFRRRLERLLPAASFAGCRAPLSVSAFDLGARRTVVLDDGDLASALVASCAFPGLLHPVRRAGRLLSDGGILDRPGLAGLRAQPAGEVTFYHCLASRSPWRRRSSPVFSAPARRDTITLRILGLPRVNPFRLGAGRAALSAAREATHRALAAPYAALIDVGALSPST
ncbi:MAG TPA: patatin-like phospholipase family protein [Kofleriaceae bacterium]|nr:patatin-like phospholipase family protein [Kofleriaceae bacterium]